ncbi:ABC transporter ATP-binding protein [Vallitalea longa]|uniref:ABC transporter ATP-binding protein n=1 Tax=Vallitalea longa TaxID=2936439 RepID=A0A9W5YAK7_9FIRM|nr:ABC transporter ATP-binding protein [Vallitalea longa]GKX27763.1 ABC transporter ATP-binding protein [Vallitalea longa]
MLKNTKTVIDYRHLYFKYEGSNEKALSDINLTIEEGEFIVLTGKSGCGKTTLTRCVNGLISNFYKGEFQGNAKVWEHDLIKDSIREISREVGSVFQDPRSQFFTLHVKTEIPFSSENYGIDCEIIQENIKKSVYDLKLNNLINKSLLNLSSGEKQKIAIASVYTLGAFIYVLDEPSSNLDYEGTKQLGEILKKLKEKGHTIIISEHRLNYLKNLADRVVYMEEGKIKEIIDGKDFIKKSPLWLAKNDLRQLNISPIDIIKYRNSQDTRNTNPPILKAMNLSFKYRGGKNILDNISFNTYGGDIIGIIGKNGAGKSTLLKILMGLEKPNKGEIYIDNKKTSKRVRIKNSTYVMQDVDYQLFAPSVLEEMIIGLKDSEEIRDKARKYLEFFNLLKYIDRHPASLSGGQKQRLAIAMACMKDSRLLFFDEPTSGLDAANMKQVSSAIKKISNGNRCIFVITHDEEFASITFNKILRLNEDKTITFRNMNNEKNNYIKENLA